MSEEEQVMEEQVIGTILNVQNNLVQAMENIQTNLANTMSDVQNNIENRLIDPTNMSIVSSWPRELPGLGTSAERFVDEVNKIDSMFNVNYEASGEFTGNPFTLVSEGKKNAYISADYYWVPFDPAYAFFTSVPGGMKTIEHIAWILFGEGQALWDEVAAKHNLKPFLIGSTGLQPGFYSNREFNSVTDFKDTKIRQPGLGGKIVEKLGATSVDVSGSELYDALKSGTVDATEWVGPWNDFFMKLHEISNYFYYTNVSEMGSILSLGLNLDFWNSLTPEKQAMIENLSRAEALKCWTQYWSNNSHYLLEIQKAAPDLKFLKFPQEIQDALFQTAHEVLAEFAEDNGELTKRIWKSYVEQLNKFKEWSMIDLYSFTQRNSKLPISLN